MTGKFPMGKPRSSSWGVPFLAVSLTVIVHVVWLVIPQKEMTLRPEPKGVRLYAYPNLDARAWSPTLFSLPSSLGFSGAIRKNTNNVLPPLKSPLKLTTLSPVDLTALFPEPGLEKVMPVRSRLPVTVRVDSPEELAEPPSFVWTLQVLEGKGSRLELNRLPAPPADGNALVLNGVMTFDPAGQITSLFLEPNSLKGSTRAQIIRALRRVRRSGEATEGRIRFRFAYQPAGVGT